MHPLTRFFNYLKRIDFALALTREHIDDRELTEWYPNWMYELMETDETRNGPYRDAIRELVADRIVLELGTGRKALWAIHCVRAGAKRVYAIEANRKAYQASLEVVRAQKIENLQIVCGFSDKVELPERCNVLVHDLVGDIGSSEGMVSFVADARKRLLTSDAIHIPRRCTTHVFLAEDPELRSVEWALSYVLRGFQRYEPLRFVRFFSFPHSAALSSPQVFEDIVLDRNAPFDTSAELQFEIERDGELRGVCFFIRLHLDENRIIDTWTGHTSWSTPFVRFRAPTRVRKGDIALLQIRSDVSASPSYALKLIHKCDGAIREIGDYAWSGD
jgi:hypothetical protein